MHIMEGYLPWQWCLVWFAIALPIVFFGINKITKIIRENPEQKMIVALSGAFIFLLSSLKLPSVTGSSSHPTGTGLSAVLYGVSCTAFLSTIVLVFQALLLAHGGITTLGANIFSMGIAGPAVAFVIWFALRRAKVSVPVSMFFAAMLADLVTYVVTALQLTAAFGGAAGYGTAFIDFMTIFAVTQVPLAIVEGAIFSMFAKYLADTRPQIFGLEPKYEGAASA
ncbi:MAG: energy-coupling factor ABC transporter permease [Candidatus Methanomethylophilaceae archaeon]|jgi:cobalt/nickel transport system permease protein|nr:energy-coupling factor ABC transporter permease [Candidatus Methanomethylophilaceae archaeon]MDD3351689.1 energy-coupling factor ABC transporter permease [Candidatus Methanomethylophilaceae archaeon]MDD3986154.1 energy-coupling factor ABC transporter permease [Candidatus Methanomethylophilaceae archaeon]MDD4709015.1 energy-coupling factor ABC transporter permease [Candidatus Methanomethylophilaceae archaeon]MDY0251830.1 energy-coupling factor ABC transporter permease [Candidatus Methanomethy